MYHLKHNFFWFCLFWFFLHLCLYIKEIKPLCWTLSSIFPKSFNRVSPQLPIRSKDKKWWRACWGLTGSAQVGAFLWSCREQPWYLACLSQTTSFSLPLSPQAVLHRPPVSKGQWYKLHKGWICVYLIPCFISSSWHRNQTIIVPKLMLAE